MFLKRCPLLCKPALLTIAQAFAAISEPSYVRRARNPRHLGSVPGGVERKRDCLRTFPARTFLNPDWSE
jgi:hypothetical protein